VSTTTSSEMQHPDLLQQARKAGLNRWKLETLTGLLGYRALQHHQRETEKNTQAENKAVRKRLWNADEPDEPEDTMGNTILGDVTHPTPVIVTGGNQSSGLAKTLAGLAIGALIPSAGVGGYLVSQLLSAKQPQQQVQPETQQDAQSEVELGLRTLSDLEGWSEK
jgi:hypothetical protein